MKDRDYKKLSQEIRDVLLYNQCKTRTILDEIKRIDIPDHNEEDDVSLSEQKRFLEERGISIDVEGILKTERIPESDESIAVPELTWDEIVRTARSSGYKDVKIEDILTPEEIDRANREFDQITEDFKKKQSHQ